MIVLPTDSLQLYVAGLTDCRIADPESSLRELRSHWPDLQLQLIRADRVAGPEHLQFAARNALLAHGGKRRHARSLAVEFLLYASCTHQISKAIERLGVTGKTRNVALAAFAKRDKDVEGLAEEAAHAVRGRLADSILEVSGKKIEGLMKAYGVTSKELEAAKVAKESNIDALKRLIIERSALVAVEN